MKLIQLNAWGWRLYWPIRRFLEAERPDFLLAQESIDANHYQAFDRYTASGIIAEKLMGYYVQSSGKRLSYRDDHENRTGNAIFANKPLEPAQTLTMDEGNPQCQLLHTVVDCAGQHLNLLTYHGRLGVDISGNGTAVYGNTDLVEGQPRLGNLQSQADFIKIAAYIDALSGPTILTGDFNLWPDARVLEPLTGRLRNLVTMGHMNRGRNELAWKTDEIVNHCFVSDEIKVNEFRIARDLVSDHQPLVLEFDVT